MGHSVDVNMSDLAFQVAGPQAWNSLQESKCLSILKEQL